VELLQDAPTTNPAAPQPATESTPPPPVVVPAPKPREGDKLVLKIPRKAAAKSSTTLTTPAPSSEPTPKGPMLYTPRPFPERHLPSLATLRSEISPANCYLVPFGPAATVFANRAAIANACQAVIADLSGSEDVQVAPPNLSAEAKMANTFPTLFLVAGLSKEEGTDTGRVGTVSYHTGASFTLIPLQPRRPTLAVVLKGFTTTDPELAANLVKARLHDPEVRGIFAELCVQTEDHANPLKLKTILEVVDSIKATVYPLIRDKIPHPQYAITCDSSLFAADTHWDAFAELLGSISFETPFNGTAEATESQWNCKVCRGPDHPSGICPFPRVPNWFGPGVVRDIHASKAGLTNNGEDYDSEYGGRDSPHHADYRQEVSFRGRGGRGRGGRGRGGQGRGGYNRGGFW
jgi:hypothetical protein